MAEARSIHSFFLTAPNQHRPFCDLAGRTAQPCPSPALCALFPHPLQNRVPRVQVLLPLPQNRRKHWVFAGFLFARVAWSSGAFWFGFLVSPPVRTGCTPLQHPKRTRFRLFLAESGAFSSFLLFFWCKIFVLVFVHPAA